MQDGPEFRHFVAFVTVAEECHFGKAALRLHLTQPALSEQIKQLESWLGEHLFRRVPHGAELTDKGKELPCLCSSHPTYASARVEVSVQEALRNGMAVTDGLFTFIDREIIYEALTGYQEMSLKETSTPRAIAQRS
jgi:hypothetical protein